MSQMQKEELELAVKEGRQPLCVRCHQPMDVIEQESPHFIVWEWNGEMKRYYSHDEVSNDAPAAIHVDCDNSDWDFVGVEEAHEKLGLTY